MAIYEPRANQTPVDPTKCREGVWDDSAGLGFLRQCAHSPKYDGKCGVHRPGAAEERAKKRGPTQFERECAARDRQDKHLSWLEELERWCQQLVFSDCDSTEWGEAMDAIGGMITKQAESAGRAGGET